MVKPGDQLITLEERLEAISKSLRRLTIILGVLIGTLVLHAVVGPETFAQIVSGLLELAT